MTVLDQAVTYREFFVRRPEGGMHQVDSETAARAFYAEDDEVTAWLWRTVTISPMQVGEECP